MFIFKHLQLPVFPRKHGVFIRKRKVSVREPDDSECFTKTALNFSASNEMQAHILAGVNFTVATADPKPTSLIPPAISPARESENFRVKQTGTRLTEAEFAEVEAAAAGEGTNISAWICSSLSQHPPCISGCLRAESRRD